MCRTACERMCVLCTKEGFVTREIVQLLQKKDENMINGAD